MPAEQEEVVGAVGFFQNDDDTTGAGVEVRAGAVAKVRSGLGAGDVVGADAGAGVADVVAQFETGEVGGGAVCVVGSVGADCPGCGDGDLAVAEEFDGKSASVREVIASFFQAIGGDSFGVVEGWLFADPEGPVESVVGSIVDA